MRIDDSEAKNLKQFEEYSETSSLQSEISIEELPEGLTSRHDASKHLHTEEPEVEVNPKVNPNLNENVTSKQSNPKLSGFEPEMNLEFIDDGDKGELK